LAAAESPPLTPRAPCSSCFGRARETLGQHRGQPALTPASPSFLVLRNGLHPPCTRSKSPPAISGVINYDIGVYQGLHARSAAGTTAPRTPSHLSVPTAAHPSHSSAERVAAKKEGGERKGNKKRNKILLAPSPSLSLFKMHFQNLLAGDLLELQGRLLASS